IMLAYSLSIGVYCPTDSLPQAPPEPPNSLWHTAATWLGARNSMTDASDAAMPHGVVIDTSQWVNRHGDRLYRFALMRVRNVSVAEELVQETFLAGLQSQQSFKGQSSEATWLTGILKHKIMDHFRRSVRETVTEDIEAEADAWFTAKGRWATPPSLSRSPMSDIEQEELRNELVGCMGELPQRLSTAFVLTQIDGFDTGETCKVLHITPTNLWVMLHRARMRLRNCLERKGFGRSKAC
ncbi:MAG: sigma-70 family RNA polymerase sigma factor, partial [Gammaproteobacteria bacterium]